MAGRGAEAKSACVAGQWRSPGIRLGASILELRASRCRASNSGGARGAFRELDFRRKLVAQADAVQAFEDESRGRVWMFGAGFAQLGVNLREGVRGKRAAQGARAARGVELGAQGKRRFAERIARHGGFFSAGHGKKGGQGRAFVVEACGVHGGVAPPVQASGVGEKGFDLGDDLCRALGRSAMQGAKAAPAGRVGIGAGAQ